MEERNYVVPLGPPELGERQEDKFEEYVQRHGNDQHYFFEEPKKRRVFG